MIGLIIGVACGVFELFFLSKLARAITSRSEKSTLPYILAKIVGLALALALTVLIVPMQLVYCGIGIAGVLIGGSIILFLRNRNGDN